MFNRSSCSPKPLVLSTKSAKSFPCHTYEKCACKSFACHTYKNKGLKVLCLPHIRKMPRGWGQKVQFGRRSSLVAPPKPRRKGVVQLHQDDESNAPIRVQDAEQGADRVQPLPDQDSPANRRRHLRRNIVTQQLALRRVPPA